MRAIVVGAGAWGLPTAAELARRGHHVILVDRYGPGNTLSSSSGPTRLWRVADPDPAAIRLGRRGQEATRRLESRLGHSVHTTSGLVWRDSAAALERIAAAVEAEGVAHTAVPARSVGSFFAGLHPDERDALWFPESGSLLSANAIAGYRRLFERSGGQSMFGPDVTSVVTTPSGAAVSLTDGRRLDADVAVVCAGPGTAELLAGIGVTVPLRAQLEQVVHLGRAADPHCHDALPCLFDGPGEHGAGVYAMATPGLGYKIGIDSPLRELRPGDTDRRPVPGRTSEIVRQADRLLPTLGGDVLDELVCCWTDSPDGWFVVDRAEAVVVACGDSGKGFKYSPVMGEILADLAEGGPADSDVVAMSARRFEGRAIDPHWSPTSLGRAPA